MKAILIILILGCGQWAKSQINTNNPIAVECPEIALLDVEPDQSSILFEPQVLGTGGDPLELEVVSTTYKWVNFTSSVRESSSDRKIEVELLGYQDSGPVDLSIRLIPELESAKGDPGDIKTEDFIKLKSSPVTVINKIRGGTTGNGETGYKVEFKSTIKKFRKLESGALIYTLVYTITDV